MKIKSIIGMIVITILLSSLMIFVGWSESRSSAPQEVYQVYLDGKKLGLIKDEDELYELINKEGESIKKEYNVDTVYPPNGLEIKKYITYDDKIIDVKDLYEDIKDVRPFTISAYVVTIKPSDEKEPERKINVLKEEDFTESLNSFIKAFVDEDAYEKFINDKQEEIDGTGELIETIYFDETITIKKAYVSAEETIFTNKDDLSQFLLFGTTEKQKTYTVQTGEDIETIAYNHELSTEEFLIANPSFSSVNQLLSAGQEVNIGLINPQLSLVEESHVVRDEESLYDTEIEYDNTLSAGVRYTKQEGENGINRTTMKVIKVNGDNKEIIPVSSDEIKPAVPKIIVRGNKAATEIYDNSVWKWPSVSYTISSEYGYRWGSFHRALDISGRNNSPIYAASGGIVVYSGYQTKGGNMVYIDHQNGYYSEYAHMNKSYVSPGQVVERGYTIGAMGCTGTACTGTHLHFGIWVGYPFGGGSYTIDPMSRYR